MTYPTPTNEKVMNNAPYDDHNSDKHPQSLGSMWRSLLYRLRKLLHLTAPTLRESLEEAMQEHDAVSDKTIDSEEKLLLRNVLEFRELSVEDIMVPRPDMVMVPHDVSLHDLQHTIIEKTHTRIPVYRESPDDIIGFIHTKDLVSYISDGENFKTKDILRQLMFVPPSMRILDLLLHMRTKRIHMAVVVDEYGGTSGLVTMEDVMEEIVGEIEDEHDTSDQEVLLTQINSKTYEVSARMDVTELEQELRLMLKSEEADYSTVGGMIFEMVGRVPAEGEIIKHPSGVEFKVVEADARRIKRMKLKRLGADHAKAAINSSQ